MNRPFFSVLLPTKNRSEIVGGAVASLLAQTFADFELIVSDNDDSDVKTREAIAKFTDPRVRYFRTAGNLPMHANWENALNQATGRFVMIIEDKMRFVSNALEVLHGLAAQHGDVVISYDVAFIKGADLPPLNPVPPPLPVRSVDLAEKFRRFELDFFRMHPKSLDSCAPLEIIRRARAQSPTGMFFSYVTPDYSSGFLLLRTVESILFLNAGLAYIPNDWMANGRYSVGQASYQKAAITARWLKELPVTIEDIQSYSPVKCQWLWINNAMYDYFTKYANPLKAPAPDWVRFHAFCFLIVILGWRMGANMSEDLAAIRASLATQSIGFRLRVYTIAAQRVAGMAFQFISNRLR
ncbi:MAG TPA: glycosyltransferase family 2 protein [Candidatus Limnocylindria bacterium]|jgi:glycosyltransferase involved in cell wall biosynthesis|nr:glycosyltransferase family 2 protein [Candidatus Limnocylindria bacterium]